LSVEAVNGPEVKSKVGLCLTFVRDAKPRSLKSILHCDFLEERRKEYLSAQFMDDMRYLIGNFLLSSRDCGNKDGGELEFEMISRTKVFSDEQGR